MALFILGAVAFSCKKDKGSSDGPKISSITPSSVLTGDLIKINGHNLSGATVQIGGIACNLSNNTATSITTNVPSGASSGTQEVIVENSAGKAKSRITVTGKGAGPAITSITPAETAPGKSITIKGTGLGNAVVEIYKKLAVITANTATEIMVTVPSGIPVGQAAVGVTTPLGYVTSQVTILKEN